MTVSKSVRDVCIPSPLTICNRGRHVHCEEIALPAVFFLASHYRLDAADNTVAVHPSRSSKLKPKLLRRHYHATFDPLLRTSLPSLPASWVCAMLLELMSLQGSDGR